MGITPVPPPTSADIQKMVAEAVADALAAKKSSFSWAVLRGNKYFVGFTTLLGGAVAGQAWQAIQAGTFVWSHKAIHDMIGTALLTAITGLYHLYTTPSSGANS